MRASLGMVASLALALALPLGGCRTSACGGGFLEVDRRCFDPKADCDVVCGVHEVCDITTTPNECNCAAGFAGDPCAWIGVVADPEFRGTPDADGGEAWVAQGGEVNPDADANPGGGQGEAELFQPEICDGGSLMQEIQMPAYAAGGPLIAEVVYRAAFVDGLAVGFGDSWVRLPATGQDFETRRFCLGEAAYWRPQASEPTLPAPVGGRVALRLSASGRLNNVCSLPDGELSEIRIDAIDIRPPEAGEECPGPADPPTTGGTINGDAEPNGRGWRFECSPEPCAAGEFVTVNTFNDGVRTVARIARDQASSGVQRLTTRVSVPLPTESLQPALAFWWTGSRDELFRVEIGTFDGFGEDGEPRRARPLATLIGGGGGQSPVYCLPPWTHGSVIDLSFELPSEAQDPVELLIDDLQVVHDADCVPVGESTEGFEAAPTQWAGSSLVAVDQRVNALPLPALAFEGNGVLELSYDASAADGAVDPGLAIQAYVMAPEPDENGGPAVEFYANPQLEPGALARWSTGTNCLTPAGGQCACRGEVEDEEASTFERTEICLPSAWAGRWYRLDVRVEPSGEALAPGARSRLFLDNIRVTTSPNCACP
ncbi:MAG: hypothetical protein AAF500_04550 [Myxococcota bacterium]